MYMKGDEIMMDLFPRRYLGTMLDDFVPTRMDSEMKCDVYEKEGNYHIEMDLPGYSKEDISVEAKDGFLTIRASKDENKEETDESKNYIRRERVYGSCERTFSLGDLDQENIEASFKDGTLSIVVPKKEVVEDKTVIEIK